MNMRKAIADWLMKSSTTYGWHSFGLSAPPGSSWQPDSHVVTAYAANAIAHACISRIAKDVAGVPLLFLRDSDDDTSYVPDSDPLQRLFHRPNDTFTMRRLLEWSMIIRMLRGEVFWRLQPGPGNQPGAILPWYDPLWWRERVTAADGLIGWDYNYGTTSFTDTADNVLWMGTNNPTNPYRGMSPLRAAASALGIDNTSDTLQGDLLTRGGEKAMLFEPEVQFDKEQQEQLLSSVAQRRPGMGQAVRDFMLPFGVKPLPATIARDDVTSWQHYKETHKVAKVKICSVFGLAPVLIGDDDSAQYQSAPHAIKLYWRQTLIPLLRSLEDAWDHYFTDKRGMKTYVRFDLSSIEALREDERDKAETARVYSTMSIPLSVINDKLDLGFPAEDMAAADAAAEDRRQAAASIWQLNEHGEAVTKAGGLDNEMIRKRHHDAFAKTQRVRALSRLEVGLFRDLAKLANDYGKRVAADVERAGLASAPAAVRALEPDLRGDVLAVVEPAHVRAVQIGVVSIQDLVTGKAHEPWHDRVKTVSMAPRVNAAMIRHRQLMLESVQSFTDVMAKWASDEAAEAALAGESADAFARRVQEQYTHMAKARAVTIAQNEIGAMYSVARFEETKDQGFDKHTWLAAVDEVTRDSHFAQDGETVRIGAAFSNGLIYPQEDGAAAEEVINCRCETIPVV